MSNNNDDKLSEVPATPIYKDDYHEYQIVQLMFDSVKQIENTYNNILENHGKEISLDYLNTIIVNLKSFYSRVK